MFCLTVKDLYCCSLNHLKPRTMNDYQIAKLASYKLMVKEAKNYPNIISLIPSFETGINRLDAITIEVDDIGIQQAKDITGITADKNSMIDDLNESLVDVSGAMHSIAVSRNDKTLQAKVNFRESKIDRMTQPELMNAAAIVLEEAGKISPKELADEGISAEELTNFRSVYTQTKIAGTDTRGAIIDRSGHTQKLSELFGDASDLKKNTLDRLVSQFKRKSPEFYQKYKAAAMVNYRRRSRPAAAEAK